MTLRQVLNYTEIIWMQIQIVSGYETNYIVSFFDTQNLIIEGGDVSGLPPGPDMGGAVALQRNSMAIGKASVVVKSSLFAYNTIFRNNAFFGGAIHGVYANVHLK